MKYLFSMQKFCSVLQAYPDEGRRMEGINVKRVEKRVERVNICEYKYLNPIFIIHLLAGNVIYFKQDPLKVEDCFSYSDLYSSLQVVVFIIILVGYFQCLYYGTLWYSIVFSKKKIQDGGRHDTSSEE